MPVTRPTVHLGASRISVIFTEFTHFPRDVSETHALLHSTALQSILCYVDISNDLHYEAFYHTNLLFTMTVEVDHVVSAFVCAQKWHRVMDNKALTLWYQ